MATNSYQLGIKAELLTAQYFNKLGFSVIFLRYKTKFGEIDLILKRGNQIVFIEVKARSIILPIDQLITQKQIDRNYAAAEFFLSQFPEYLTYECRFDIVILHKDRIIHHIENII